MSKIFPCRQQCNPSLRKFRLLSLRPDFVGSHMQTREPWADILRAAATVAVIAIHTVAAQVHGFGSVSWGVWWTAHITDVLARPAVPLFVMLSGALLLPRREPLSDILKKRIPHVLMALLCWASLYTGSEVINLWVKVGTPPDDMQRALFFETWLRGGSGHLWYLEMLPGLYLTFPLIGAWLAVASNRDVRMLLIIWLAAMLFAPWASLHNTHWDLRYVSGYIGYAIAGAYLHQLPFAPASARRWGVLAFVIGAISAAGGAFIQSSRLGFYYDFWAAYLNVPVAVMSLGAFLFVRHGNLKPGHKLLSMISLISRHSFGIYLIHIFGLIVLGPLGIHAGWPHPLLAIPTTVLICTTISLGAVMLLKKISGAEKVM